METVAVVAGTKSEYFKCGEVHPGKNTLMLKRKMAVKCFMRVVCLVSMAFAVGGSGVCSPE